MICLAMGNWSVFRERIFLENVSIDEHKRVNIIFVHGEFFDFRHLLPGALDYRLRNIANTHCISMRNHGHSTYTDNMDLDLLAKDIANFIKERGLKRVYLVGAHLGAKVIQQTAISYPSLIEGILPFEIMPFATPATYLSGLITTLSGLLNVNLKLTKAQIKDEFLKIIAFAPFSDIELALLEGTEGNYTWKANLPVILNSFNKLYSNAVKAGKFTGKVAFVFGKDSPNYKPEALPGLLAYYPKFNVGMDVLVVQGSLVPYISGYDDSINFLVNLINK